MVAQCYICASQHAIGGIAQKIFTLCLDAAITFKQSQIKDDK